MNFAQPSNIDINKFTLEVYNSLNKKILNLKGTTVTEYSYHEHSTILKMQICQTTIMYNDQYERDHCYANKYLLYLLYTSNHYTT